MTLDILEKLRPSAKPRMMDLVQQAGIDVAPWAFRADGKPVKAPAANPAYCYEWCFANNDCVVLSLWFELMSLENGRVVQRVNMRDLRRRVERAKHLDAGTRTANVRRAVAVDSAVQRAFRQKLPARVIVCDGDRRDMDDVARRDPSKVERRLLDDSPWRVIEYDDARGDTVIVRDQPLDTGTRS
jgi:5-methylcytosine-specific restriction enzyme A